MEEMFHHALEGSGKEARNAVLDPCLEETAVCVGQPAPAVAKAFWWLTHKALGPRPPHHAQGVYSAHERQCRAQQHGVVVAERGV